MLGAMEIVVAKHMGFCGGVKRAVEMAGGTADAASGAVYTWGPLIHNPQVVSRLQDAGVRVAGALEDLRGDAFVVSAYGVEHAVLDAAKARGVRTPVCPATRVREEGADRMGEEVDARVVMGAHHSANPPRLWEIGQAHRLPTFHIEVADELKPDWFEGVTRVGVMSGASTPDWIVSDVLHRLDEIGREHEPTRPTQSARPIPSQAERD